MAKEIKGLIGESVEKVDAAAESLSQQASRLVEAVSIFTLRA